MALKTATQVVSAYTQQPFPVAGYHGEIYRLPAGATAAPVAATSISSANPGVVTKASHGLSNGDVVTFTTTGALPGTLSNNQPYYVVNKATDTFELSLTSTGTSIDTSSAAGSGTHSYSAADVAVIVPPRGRFVASVLGGPVVHVLGSTGTDPSVTLRYAVTTYQSSDVLVLVQE
jgi:hypothetical protein